jgi:hypothetical protein
MSPFRQFRWLPADGSTPIVLGDDQAGDKVSSDPPSQERLTDTLRFFQNKYALQVHRGNRTNVITWRVDRDHGDANTAKVFSRMHNDEVPTAGILEDGGQGFTTLYLLNATIVTRCVSIDGQSTVFEYTVRGGPWSTSSAQ